MAFAHVMLTTDFSDDAARAFDLALRLARRDDATLTLVHVVEAIRAVPHAAPFAAPLPMPGLDVLVKDANERLRLDVERLRVAAPHLKIESTALVAGEVGPALAEEATARGCDLIVLSTHGRSGLRRLVLGSVAEAVIRHAHVPVLAVPPER